MSKFCPLTSKKVLYLECLECDDKANCNSITDFLTNEGDESLKAPLASQGRPTPETGEHAGSHRIRPHHVRMGDTVGVG